MGKPTGFLDYERVEATAVSPKERIKNFNEFHTPLSEDEQRKQSSRCMDCGVPFCQSGMTIKGMTSGCPLNNLIPEWNDLLTQETGNRHITGYTRQVTSLNLQAVCVLHSVRKHVHADLMARQYVPKRMKWQSLNMHMPKVMRKQILLR